MHAEGGYFRGKEKPHTRRAISEKSLEVDDSRVAGPLTMPLVSSSFDTELASAPLPARLQQVMQ